MGRIVEIWLEKASIKDILNTDKPFVNMNIFHQHPNTTSYPCYGAVKVKIEITEIEEDKNG